MKKGDYLVQAGSKHKYQIVGTNNGDIVLATNSDRLDEVLIIKSEELEELILSGKFSC